MSAIECANENFAIHQLNTDEALATSEAIPIPSSDSCSAIKNQESPIRNLGPVSHHTDGAVKSLVDSRSSPDWKDGRTLPEGDLIVHNAFNNPHGLTRFDQCTRRTKPMRPSKLNPSYSRQGGIQSSVSVFREQDRGYAQTPPDDASRYGASANEYGTPWLLSPNNTMHLGYHTESNERTKVLPDNSNWQLPSNLIGQHDYQLSASPIACPTPIVRTPQSNHASSFPVYKFPNPFPYTAPSYSSISHILASQGDPSQHIGTQVKFNGTHRPAASTTPATAGPIASFAHLNQPISVKNRLMAQPSNGKVSTAKKRPRTMNQTQTQSGSTASGGHSTSGRMVFTPEDHNRIQTLITAMNDMSASEDNEGMIRSWDKMRLSRAARITAVCEELLITTKKAVALNGRPLCERKKSSNKYATFEDRFNAICNTLRTQKTVCKHLMEDPYLYQVVDDPIYASMRVANNRRVNKGKKVAIEQGRKILGLKGNGKGRPLVKNEGRKASEDPGLEDNFSEDGEYSEDGDADEDATKEDHLEYLGPLKTPALRDRSTLKKPSYVTDEPEDGQESTEDDQDYPTKKIKRQKRSKAQEAVSIDSTAESSTNQIEDIYDVKPEPEARYPITHFAGNSVPSQPSPVQPMNYPFGLQGDINGSFLPFDSLGYHTGYLDYDPAPYQQLTPPMYPPAQPATQNQLHFPPQLDTELGANESYFDSSSNAENYTSDPISDETDIPLEFMNPGYLLNSDTRQSPQA